MARAVHAPDPPSHDRVREQSKVSAAGDGEPEWAECRYGHREFGEGAAVGKFDAIRMERSAGIAAVQFAIGTKVTDYAGTAILSAAAGFAGALLVFFLDRRRS